MKIGLQTWGSDGDVRPFIALASGLSANGHNVTLVITNPEMKDYTSYGNSLNFKIINAHDTYKEWDDNILFAQLNKRLILNKNPVKQLISILEDLFEPAVDEMYEVAKTLCNNNDVVIGHLLVHPFQLAAVKTKCPYGTVVFSPTIFSSRYITPTGLPYLGDWMNSLWWKLAKSITNKSVLKYVNRLRSREGYSDASDLFSDVWESKKLTLIGASPTLFDRPSDWKNNLQVCGFFSVPEKAEEWIMPEDLKKFIDEGDPPIYMTFGSITPITLQKTMELFIDAVKIARCRAIIQSQWDTVSNISEHPDIYRIGTVPHHKIFPYCAFVVHHGGAGTTHSASLSGCPSIIVEHFGDQIFWGIQLKKLGIANKILHKRSVTSRILSIEIRKVLDSSKMKRRAQKISESMKKENGVKRAVELVEEYLLT